MYNLTSFLLAQTAASTPVDFQKLAPWPVWIVLGIVLAIIGALYFRSKGTAGATAEDDFRHLVAKSVLFSAIWGLVTVSALTILMNNDRVLTLLLPVFGTWVGTLLAYYFGKDNYEAGARNSATLARALTGIEKLRSIPAAAVMIRASDIKVPALVQNKGPADYATILLKDLVMTEQRLPLIDPSNGTAVAVAHKSLIDGFLVKNQATADKVTLQDLLNDSESGKVAKSSFVLVPNTATLADTNDAMTQKSKEIGISCEDAFVTPPASSRVEGWITNDIIAKNAQV